MPERALRKILEDLHRSLEETGDLDPEARDALRATANEIQEALEAERGETSLSDRFSDSLTRWEGSHPKLTEVVRRLVDQLSEMGI